jgi:hypothetical protein
VQARPLHLDVADRGYLRVNPYDDHDRNNNPWQPATVTDPRAAFGPLRRAYYDECRIGLRRPDLEECNGDDQ